MSKSKTMKVIDGDVDEGALPRLPEGKGVTEVAPFDPTMAIVERALATGNVEIIERVLALQERVQDRAAKAAYLAALPKLQAKLPAIERKGTGHNKTRYARFEDLIKGINGPMTECGFSLTFRIEQEAGTIKITGVLGHEGGHQEQTSLTLPADTTGNKNAVQALGSSTSYGKRYVGMTLLGIATEDEDDDGKAAGDGAKIGTEDVEKLRSLLMETKSDLAFFYNLFDIECLEDMPTAKLSTALKMLELKKTKKAT